MPIFEIIFYTFTLSKQTGKYVQEDQYEPSA